MEKARNIAFGIICAAVFLACAWGEVGGALMGENETSKSYLEGREYRSFPEATLESFLDGSFQDGMDGYLSDAVPNRNGVVLGNAFIQRTMIEAANIPFGFDAYHTFLSSNYVYSPSQDRLYEEPLIKSKWEAACSEYLPEYRKIVDNFPEINWRVAAINRPSTTTNSPASALMSQHADYGWFKQNLANALRDNDIVVDLDNVSFADGDYYATDHHIDVQGTIDVYNRIIGSFGRTPIEFGEKIMLCEDDFFGSLARGGLYPNSNDKVYDVEYDHGTYEVLVDGKKKDMGYLCATWRDEPYTKSDEFCNVYAECFHGDPGLIEIRNAAAPEGTLAIIGDSYTNALERFFAENYQTVYVLDLRHYDGTLEGFIDSHEVDDCVFLMSFDHLANKEIASRVNE